MIEPCLNEETKDYRKFMAGLSLLYYSKEIVNNEELDSESKNELLSQLFTVVYNELEELNQNER